MRLLWPVTMLFGVAVLVPAFRTASDWWAAHRCLDRGGAYYGSLGCLYTEPPVIDRLVLDKSERRLDAYQGSRRLRSFSVSLGSEPLSDKREEGDGRTPEGVYPVVLHKEDSAYFRALRLGYPTTLQADQARREGRDPGGDIMIHGLRNGLGWIGGWHRAFDWTRGCIALTNGEMLWLYRAVQDGTPVAIHA